MSTCLITNVRAKASTRSKSKFISFSSCNNAISQVLSGVTKINTSKIKQLSRVKEKLVGKCGFREKANLDITARGFKNFVEKFVPSTIFVGGGGLQFGSPTTLVLRVKEFPRAEIKAFITLVGILNSRVGGEFFFANNYVDKFSGNIEQLSNLKSLTCSEKLYPIQDEFNQTFVDKNLSPDDLFNKINNGVFLGNYNENLGIGFRVSDDDQSYIQPSSVLKSGTFRYQCEVSAPNYHPKHSFLFLRAAAALSENDKNEVPPAYRLYNLVLEDPYGNTIVKYKDLLIKGDAKYITSPEINYTTYISEPQINNANLFTWEENYPELNENSGYKLSLDCDIICESTPFTKGFNFGYEENVCDKPSLVNNPNNYLALDGAPFSTQSYALGPNKTLRISAIEICNSGGLNTRKDIYLPIYTDSILIGKKISRTILPVELFSVDYDIGLYPSNNTLWESSPNADEFTYQNINQENSRIILNYINQYQNSQYITLLNSTPLSDSGRLTFKFSHQPQQPKSELRGGPFNKGFFKNAFDDSEYESVTPVDNYFLVDSLELKIIAKKAPNTRDFAIDVVGYSDDKILNVTPKIGAFLQNADAGEGLIPLVSGFEPKEDLGISTEAISDKKSFFKRGLTSIDAGDHYKLSSVPVINTTQFKEYSIPLQIYEDRVDVGKSTDYSMSSYFEHLYLDLFGIPSGASIQRVELVVNYKPTNAVSLFTLGRPNSRQLDRKDISLFPQGWNKSNDILINSNVEDHPLSLIENIPQAYKEDSTLKTNYSRRWRGVDGNILFGPYSFSEFDFSFQNPQADQPFLNGFFDFNVFRDNHVISNNNYAAELYSNNNSFHQFSGYYNGQASVIKNIGLRFDDKQLFPHNTSHTSIDWATNGDPLYGKICDAFDCALRVSGEFGNINFQNVPVSSGFAIYLRFTPDYNMSGVNYNLFNSGVLFSKWDSGNNIELVVGFENGKITALFNDVDYGLIKLQDNQTYNEYQYPLSVVITHEGSGKPVRLYCNNELFDNAHLKDEAQSLIIVNGSSNLVCGYSSGSGVGSNIFVHEIGLSSSGNLTNSVIDFNSKKTTVSNFLNGQSHSFVKEHNSLITQNNKTIHTQSDGSLVVNNSKFRLHEFIDEDTDSWKLGDFKFCQFSSAYDGFTKRIGKDYIVHYLNHHGSGYDQVIDHTNIQKIKASGLSYHSQIENDFLRFNLTDMPDANPHFYSTPPRICKTIPRGYKFAEKALVVETILEHQTYKDLLWNDGSLGPKLIVSLYSKNQDPAYRPSKINWGLINRSIHYLEPSGCYEKISSTFNHDDLLDTSEEWALFDLENVQTEFSEKYYSKDIDDMFLQYDLVYPCSTFSLATIDGKNLVSDKQNLFSTHQCGAPFESKIKIHGVNVKLRDALTYWTEQNDHMSLYTSGQAIRFNDLNLFTNGHIQIFDSGFCLYTSGSPWLADSGSLNMFSYGISGITTSPLNLFVKNGGSFNAVQAFGSSFGEPVFGSSDQLIYLPMRVEGGKPRAEDSISLIVSGVNFSSSDQISLFTNGETVGLGLDFASLNLYTNGFSVVETNRTEIMSLYIMNTDSIKYTAENHIPLYINTDSNIVGISGTCTLFTTNYGTVGTRAFFSWDQNNVGLAIDPIIDSGAPSISANDEIRGVDLICFGDCGSSRSCEEIPIVLHNLTWYGDAPCISGGILRPKGLYTNTDVGYSGNFYGIRKYANLQPNSPYAVQIKAITGSDSSIYLPSEYIEMNYGSNEFVNYSGIKLGADKDLTIDERQPGNKFGKSVAIRDDVIAVGAPMQTLEYVEGDTSYTLEEAGAVFIYRRDPRPEGYSWPVDQHKSPWKLETKLTLPSGLFKDYYTTTRIDRLDGQFLEFPLTQTNWEVGGEGRQLGYSLDLAINKNEQSFEEDDRQILVVGGPSAKWYREFDTLDPSGVNIGLIVVTDEFKPNIVVPGLRRFLTYFDILSAIQNKDLVFQYFSDPAVKFNVQIIILEPRPANNTRPIETFPEPKPDFISNFVIPRNSGIITQEGNNSITDVFNAIKSAFETVFPYDTNKIHNNIPAMLGVFIDDTMSLGEVAIEPGLSNFLSYYRQYSYASGLKNFYDIPVSGAVYKEVEESENWITASISILNELLDTGRLKQTDEMSLFTGGIGPDFFNTNLEQFNVAPYSGGRVYVFEKESGSWNLIQEIRSPILSYNIDRFGHSVAISKDTNIIGIGSPYIDESCQVWQFRPESKQAVFDSLSSWLSVKNTQTNGLVPRYSELMQQWNGWVEKYGFNYANKVLYSNLTQTEKFEVRKSFGIEEYSKVFSYGYGSIPYNGGPWSWISQEYAPTSRLGYDVAINEDGSVVAFGAPTDSFNAYDDQNVYFTGDIGMTDAEEGILSYSLDSEKDSDRIGSSISPSWKNVVNAGAVRLFEGRNYYPHNSVVEYGKFGNLQQSRSSEEDQKYFNYISGVFSDRNFRKMTEDEVDIPKDAGLAFIITPGVDALSDEIVDNIISWLALGDRNLVLVGNDPIWEENGAYRESNRIINSLLRRLSSRMSIQPARSREEALVSPSSVVLPSFKPGGGTKSYVLSYPLQSAYGVGDIRMHFPDFGIQKMPCLPPDEDNPYIDPRSLNEKCELPIAHNGDLRAQWNTFCIAPNGKPIIYPVNWALLLGTSEVPCPSEEPPKKGILPNGDVAPLLVAALVKQVTFVQPAIPPAFTEQPIFTTINLPTTPVGTFLTDQLQNEPAFYWDSGRRNYESYTPNVFSMPNRTSSWFVPKIFQDRQAILQARGSTTSEILLGRQKVADTSILSTEESVRNSKIIAIGNVSIESREALFDAANDRNIAFYKNLVAKNISGGSLIHQIGGWTGRSSFRDGYKDSVLREIFENNGNLVVENVVVDADYIVQDDPTSPNVFWIANPLGLPNSSEISKLKSWLDIGNKKLIITNDGSIKQVLLTDRILELLGSKIKSIYLPVKEEYPEITFNGGFNSPRILKVNPNHPIANFTRVPLENFLYTGIFIPYQQDSELTPILYVAEPVYDDRIINNSFFRLNPGVDKISFPAVAGSGYRVFVNYISENLSEFEKVTVSVANVSTLPNFPYPTGAIDASPSLIETEEDDPIYRFSELGVNIGYSTVLNSVIENSSGTINFDVQVLQGKQTIDIYLSSINGRIENPPFVPKTLRILSISGVPMPVMNFTGMESFSYISGYESVKVSDGLPRLEYVENISGVIKSINDRYCECNSPTCDCIKYNYHNQLIEDGPVVAAQEIEMITNFPAGVARSRITVIADSNLVQGKYIADEFNRVSLETDSFIKSLYPVTQFPSDTLGKQYTEFTKIVAPERGSPQKYKALTNNDGANVNFGVPGNPAANKKNRFNDLDSLYDAEFVIRPENEAWPEGSTQEIIEQFKSGIRESFRSTQINAYGGCTKFSGIIDNKVYVDADINGGMPAIMKDRGYDYLDFDKFNSSGYLGDLFGYSLALEKDTLIVGAPFAAFSYENIQNWDQYLSTQSGIELSYNGGAGAAYIYKKTNKGFGCTSAGRGNTQPWEFIQKLRPDSINIGQDLNNTISSQEYSSLGPNNYSLEYLTKHSIITDQFGYDVDIDSDIIVVGAPGHDFDKYTANSSGEFIRKEFGSEFTIPGRIVLELGNSGVRDAVSSGEVVLNNGAIFTFENSIADWTNRTQKWRFVEKIVPQGGNSRNQASEAIQPPSGNENDFFGRAVSIDRANRTDSDYVIVGGSENHSYSSSGTHFKLNAGAAYTNDIMLRQPPPVLPNRNINMHYTVFGSKLYENKILRNSISSVEANKEFMTSGLVYSDSKGNIFLEVSGQDPTPRGFIQHRPFISSIEGVYFYGIESSSDLSLYVGGRYGDIIQNMNLFVTATTGNVYNTLGMYTNSVVGLDSNTLNLSINKDPITVFDTGVFLYVSGVGNNSDTLNLRIRGS